MAKKFLIETKDGQKHVTEDLSGYVDYKLLHEDAPVLEHAKVVGKRLVEDTDLKAKRERAEKVAMPREDLVAWIERLEARIEKLDRGV
jgi:hypothetical protein